MFGSGKQPGIVQMAMDDVFNAVINQEESDLLGKVYMSFYQIYVEHIYDLLTDQKVLTPLQIREDAKRGTHVENLQLMYLKDRQTAHDLLEYGLKGRRTQSTSQNILSSRSHAVLQLHLDFEETNEFSNPLAEDGDVEDSQLYSTIYQKRHTVRRSVLTLVDLAGSERVKHYSRTISKQQFKEAVVINKSISALGNCIQALANNHSAIQHSQWVNNTSSGNMSVNSGSTASGVHIPFRDCKLTRLLAEPLGGNSKTVIIANIGPCQCNAEETLSTLKFATRYVLNSLF
jgi:kinesin family protein 18/19